jgi:hypothetical protein
MVYSIGHVVHYSATKIVDDYMASQTPGCIFHEICVF